MAKQIISESVRDFVNEQEFVNIATCDLDNRPNVAPKFLFKIESDYIYLADYVKGRSFKNITINLKLIDKVLINFYYTKKSQFLTPR